jgi:hypothetical protein
LKCVYMVLRSLDPTGQGRRRWTMRWKAPLMNSRKVDTLGPCGSVSMEFVDDSASSRLRCSRGRLLVAGPAVLPREDRLGAALVTSGASAAWAAPPLAKGY